ncbi:O-methyltransferase [Wenjunlia tyrosinilytica]|uniref:O-methyltransferase n=1 Tax=Wenjunlia tyrosinilytica TaxID=1544741 RepID=A0A917ZCN7_9ACTN|nr:O-methyltransferase [Wenjunlia tyrosinilytica]GGO80455.1 O-methyltransferase [Wenjunlia tyrosinilytica]
MKHLVMTPELYRYVLDHNPPLDEVQTGLIERTHSLGGIAMMQIAPEQAPLLAFLVRLVGARQVVEIGTFTGFSSLSMAKALPKDGRLLALDVSQEWTSIAREAWERAGVADRVELRIGPAAETLRRLPAEPWIDLAFVDADKPGYITYWEELVPRVRPGGLIVADNVLYHGDVADSGIYENAQAIRAFNDHVKADPRMDSILLPIADGVTIARRRDEAETVSPGL